ncbi:rCG23623 [Rattus norvegicus]|uniref:RCG23623 n=1 Tax=Rattus norvegicus TaxID=10116 RepID=A6KPN9_RAT|nr:rCG23623 [Rattus norvegicus]
MSVRQALMRMVPWFWQLLKDLGETCLYPKLLVKLSGPHLEIDPEYGIDARNPAL